MVEIASVIIVTLTPMTTAKKPMSENSTVRPLSPRPVGVLPTGPRIFDFAKGLTEFSFSGR